MPKEHLNYHCVVSIDSTTTSMAYDEVIKNPKTCRKTIEYQGINEKFCYFSRFCHIVLPAF